jgi:ADP-ribose pyrophosphatase
MSTSGKKAARRRDGARAKGVSRAPAVAKTAVVHARKRVFDGFFKIDAVTFSVSRYGGGKLENVARLVFERGDSAAALIHDTERDVVILTEQFRIATHKKGPGWLVEAAAGSIDEGETPEACIKREIREEIGYDVKKLTPIARFYVSPGGTSERIFLYYAPVKPRQLVDAEARGLASEHEDVERVELPLRDFFRRLERGAFEDAKLLMAAWWLRARLK